MSIVAASEPAPPSPAPTLIDLPDSLLALIAMHATTNSCAITARLAVATLARLHGVSRAFGLLLGESEWELAARNIRIVHSPMASWRATVAAVLATERALTPFCSRPPSPGQGQSARPGLRCPATQASAVCEVAESTRRIVVLTFKERAWLAWFNRFGEASNTLHAESLSCVHGWGWTCGAVDRQVVHLHSPAGECLARAISVDRCLSSKSSAAECSEVGALPTGGLACVRTPGGLGDGAVGFEELRATIDEFRARAHLASRLVVLEKPSGASGRHGTPRAVTSAAAQALSRLAALDPSLCWHVGAVAGARGKGRGLSARSKGAQHAEALRSGASRRDATREAETAAADAGAPVASSGGGGNAWAWLDEACVRTARPPCFIVVTCTEALMVSSRASSGRLFLGLLWLGYRVPCAAAPEVRHVLRMAKLPRVPPPAGPTRSDDQGGDADGARDGAAARTP